MPELFKFSITSLNQRPTQNKPLHNQTADDDTQTIAAAIFGQYLDMQ